MLPRNHPDRIRIRIRIVFDDHRLNQYQGGMCISGVMKMTERTPRNLASPSGPNWVAAGSAVWQYVHFTLALL